MFVNILLYCSYFILFYYFLINGTYIFLIFISFRRLIEYIQQSKNNLFVEQSTIIPISIIIPCYNEEKTICETIKSLLILNYPEYEIIVINDGSTDKTLPALIREFHLKRADIEYIEQIPTSSVRAIYATIQIPQLIILDKQNGGKADSLNAGVNLARYPLICSIDADSIIEKNAFHKLVYPFLKDESTIAVGGMVRIANGCKIEGGVLKKVALPNNILVRHQILEYLRAFLTNRIGFQKLNSLLIISGAFGLFKRASILELGGYRHTVGEDMELTLRLHQYMRSNHKKYRIDFVADAECWTQVPSDFASLKSQRTRWHTGLLDSLWGHKDMLFHPKYGNVGLFSLPYYWFFELFGPVVEFLGYLIFLLLLFINLVSPGFLFIFLMAYLYGAFFSLMAILLEEMSYMHFKKISEVLHLIVLAFIDQLWYRPLLVYWRLLAMFNFRKNKKIWGSIKRKTFIQEHTNKELKTNS
ncbi:glycosyltransferase family 2 protein [bacterium]|nr:glycosyltransferase family 2 protein [bacterium]